MGVRFLVREVPLYAPQLHARARIGLQSSTDAGLPLSVHLHLLLGGVHPEEGSELRCLATTFDLDNATWKREFKLPWRKAGLLISSRCLPLSVHLHLLALLLGGVSRGFSSCPYFSRYRSYKALQPTGVPRS